MDIPTGAAHPARSLESATEALTPKPAKSAAAPKPQPLKKLPTERISFRSQLDIIRAYGAASQNASRTVNYREVAKYVKLDPGTVSMMSPFLVENGFLERTGNDFSVARAVAEFAMAHTWAAETAPRKLLPVIQRSWFGNTLQSKVAFQAMSEDEAIAELGSEVSAGPDLKSRLALLIDYADAAGLIRREGNQILAVSLVAGETTGAAEPMTARDSAESRDATRDQAAPRASGTVATGFLSTEGAVQFNVSVRVTMEEMAGWSPERIASFFKGLAQVIAAKQGIEEVQR